MLTGTGSDENQRSSVVCLIRYAYRSAETDARMKRHCVNVLVNEALTRDDLQD